MPGPEFEIPPLIVPPPQEEADPSPARPARRWRVAVPATFLVLGLVAAGSYRLTSGSPSLGPTVLPTTAPAPSMSVAPTTTTTAAPARAAGVTCEPQREPGPLQSRPAGGELPGITLSFSPRVPEDTLAFVTDALATARRTFGVSGPVTVHLHCEPDQYVADSGRPPDEVRSHLDAGLVAEVFRGDIWVFGPSYARRSTSERRRIVYHEYFHTVQRQLSRNRSGRAPLWLVEGSARYFEYMVDPRDADTYRRTEVRRFGSLPPLAELEEAGGGIGSGGSGEAYPVGALASDYLVNKYGRDALQHDFWATLARTDWRAAFLEVFGVAVDEFYSEFETYRQTLRP